MFSPFCLPHRRRRTMIQTVRFGTLNFCNTPNNVRKPDDDALNMK
jgi:hypothetical protein